MPSHSQRAVNSNTNIKQRRRHRQRGGVYHHLTTLLMLSCFTLTLLCLTPSSSAQTRVFNCSSTAGCHALIDYVSPNITTLSAIKSLFGVKNLRSLLGVNDLPLSTSPNFTVSSSQKIKIPFTCSCRNGTGSSAGRPVYTVQSGDGLDHIAVDVFSRLVTYQQIAAANNITNVNNIEIGQQLYIPLPCSCDNVNGTPVVHYGYVVQTGDSLNLIAQKYGTSEDTLLKLNGLSDPKNLLASAVLDVPLRACASSVVNDSMDYPLLVSNGTYVFTANNCLQCSCDPANNWTLQCKPSQVKPSNWLTCPSMLCQGTSFYIGNTTSFAACNQTCAYAGYTNQTILRTLAPETCPASSGNGNGAKRRTGIEQSCWIFIIASFVLCHLL